MNFGERFIDIFSQVLVLLVDLLTHLKGTLP